MDQAVAALRALNAQALKPALRIALLDYYLRPYVSGLNVRHTQDAAQTSSSLNRQRAISRRLRLTAVELSRGYKQALVDVATRKNRFSGGREYRISLQRALLCACLAVATLLRRISPYRAAAVA
jgi:hypothetical protein